MTAPAVIVAAWFATGWWTADCRFRSGCAFAIHGEIVVLYALSPAPTWTRGLQWGRLAPRSCGLSGNVVWTFALPEPTAMYPASDDDPSMDRGWFLERPRPGRTHYATVGQAVDLPILPWALVSGMPGAWLVASDVRVRRRRKAGRCLSCGYDRRGLASGAPCPECGAK